MKYLTNKFIDYLKKYLNKMYVLMTLLLYKIVFDINLVLAQQNIITNPRIPNITRYESLEDIINVLLGLIRPVFILTFFGLVVYGAWLWLTSEGNADKIKKARSTIVAAIIGFSLAVFAPNIVQIVGNLLGVDNPFSILNIRD
ncbi:MAG: hypothetical protein NZZ41_01555 [Candidatus Dojkabacteria bacterium]|nr:hypothetical protein [Candidatus Dojkabacteria bacterium]